MKLKQAKTFTLIELLVVVAIIGILASMLLPSILKARKSAQNAVCLNNVKSLGTATQLLLVDGDDRVNAGHYPPAFGWTHDLSPFLGGKQITGSNGSGPAKFWQCPAPGRTTWPLPLLAKRVSYGMNYHLNKLGAGRTKSQHSILSPSETLLIGETWGKGDDDHRPKFHR